MWVSDCDMCERGLFDVGHDLYLCHYYVSVEFTNRHNSVDSRYLIVVAPFAVFYRVRRS